MDWKAMLEWGELWAFDKGVVLWRSMEEVFLIINYYEPTPIKGEGLIINRYGSIHSIHIELDVEYGSPKQS